MTTSSTVTLFRPVGQHELELIAATEYRRFPARLPHQPIFYPVLEEGYARQIARDWNTTDEASRFRGYVLRFEVRADFLEGYPAQVAGSREHQEYWIPAEDLEEFNDHIVGRIEVVDLFEPA